MGCGALLKLLDTNQLHNYRGGKFPSTDGFPSFEKILVKKSNVFAGIKVKPINL